MINTLISNFTPFDAIVIFVIIMSALMALSRGFMRELATMAALIAAIAAAFFGRQLLREQLSGWLPETFAAWSADAIIIGLAFLITYVFARFAAGRITGLIQGTEGVTIVDRLAGMVFGAARGGAAVVFLAWLMITIVPSDRVPEFISESATYPVFERAAASLNANAPRVADDIDGAFGLDNSTTEELFGNASDVLDSARDEE